MNFTITLTPSNASVTLSLDTLSALLDAATVGLDGIEQTDQRDAVADILDTLDAAAIAAQHAQAI